jgi:hypothetical protein
MLLKVLNSVPEIENPFFYAFALEQFMFNAVKHWWGGHSCNVICTVQLC